MNRQVTTVIIADQDEIFCEGLARVLERDARAQVDTHCGGVGLGELILQRSPDAVILDGRLINDYGPVTRSDVASWNTFVLVVGDDDLVPSATTVRRNAAPDEIIEMLRTADIESSRARGPGSAALSPRERQVLRLVADGFTSREIAGQLDIKQRTVEVHRHNILTKLELRGVAELVKFAIREGLTKV